MSPLDRHGRGLAGVLIEWAADFKEGANLTERLWNDGLTLLVSRGA
ncbi:hypothetical protein [Marinobacter nauticus]|jgi:hypothetical protein|nr:hypothetical protein [Marinobacter nauticus]MBY5961906.1 hypothetical protein [Marinobacter nauticus]